MDSRIPPSTEQQRIAELEAALAAKDAEIERLQASEQWEREMRIRLAPDKCHLCHGQKGGVPGNENNIEGTVMCDYCHAERLRP